MPEINYAIKLFGKTIGVLPDKVLTDITVDEQSHSSSAESTSHCSNEYESREFKENRRDRYDESIDPSESTTSSDSLSKKTPKNDETTFSNDSKEKNTLKKPEKLLPCPRCKSNDTKFCYYNNYNVKQPRHFCKKCQRYWTSGGTMRNVPVGSGRRKNKNVPSPNYHHLMVLGTLQEARPEPTNGFLIFDPNGSCENTGRAFGTSRFPFSFSPWGPPLPNPKTLRIDDPNEAAKSSVWTTLGIKNEKIGWSNKMCPFEAFDSKEGRNQIVDNTTMALYANPAALSRSLNFHERAQ
ncbi:hypothetical protein CASFOL_024154 [Castilleja foliolosa]|uniref:Dof-type domain-containing protein n=1 Tax=Castilleja foliolosa TaxID=1961234 RepID=A0ABD3CMG5_9LAMI